MRNTDGKPRMCAYSYTLEVDFFSNPLPNNWNSVFNVFVKNKKCQTDLANCWRYFYYDRSFCSQNNPQFKFSNNIAMHRASDADQKIFACGAHNHHNHTIHAFLFFSSSPSTIGSSPGYVSLVLCHGGTAPPCVGYPFLRLGTTPTPPPPSLMPASRSLRP
jgi:hypothetical protein